MFRLLLILSFCNVIASSSEHNKYIDLLPEKEKREFLETIARRIYEEIKAKGAPKHSEAEIPDEQLEVHNAYVQGIMEEEVENFKNKEKENLTLDDISPSYQGDKKVHNLPEGTRHKRTDAKVRLLNTTKHQESTISTITVKTAKIQDPVEDEITTLKKAKILAFSTTTKKELNNGTKNYDEAPDSPTTFVKSLENSTDISHNLGRKLKNYTNLVTDIKKVNESHALTLDANPSMITPNLDIYVGRPNKKLTSQETSTVSATTFKEELEISSENGTNIGNDAAKTPFNKTSGTVAETRTLEHLNNSKCDNQTNVENISSLVQDTKSILRTSQNIPVFYKSSKYYEVYEIGPGKPPFKKRESQKQLHDAPVYNFDPENAYYNPNNRLRPYVGDTEKYATKSHYEALRNEMKGQKDAYHNPIFEKPLADALTYFANILRPHKRYEHHPAINPDDYFDVQYSMGRNDEDDENDSRKHYPDLHEYDNPYKGIDKYQPLKDHLGTIRNFLYLHKRFGYIPPLKSGNQKPCTNIDRTNRDSCSKINSKSNKNNIKRGKDRKPPVSMDYYFDRTEHMASEEYDSFEMVVPFTNLNTNMTDVPEEYDHIQYRALVKVLRDMVRLDSEQLVEYPWLKTTVDIQTAIYKLSDIIFRFNFNKPIHSKDLELLKYVFYLYKSSMSNFQYENNGFLDGNNFEHDMTQSRQLPKPRFNCSKLKCKGHRCIAYRCRKHRWIMMKNLRDEDVDDQPLTALHELEDFLNEIQYHLTYFHEVIKEIATFRTYNTQQWYSDIKKMYLKNASDRQLGGVLLHLSLARLIHLVDVAQEAKDGFEDYIQNHPKIVKDTKDEFIFALRMLQNLRSV